MVRTTRLARARGVRVDAGGGRAPEPRTRDRDGVRDRVSGRRRGRRCAGGDRRRPIRGRPGGAVPPRPADRHVADPRAARRLPRRARACEAAYGALGDTGQSEVGDPLGSNGVWAAWPLGFAAAPGAYAGAAALACALLAARARRLRTLVASIGGLALAAYAAHLPPARDRGLVPCPRAPDPVRRRLPPQPRAPPLRGRAGPARPGRSGAARAPGAAALAPRGHDLAGRRVARVPRLAAPRGREPRPLRDGRGDPPRDGTAPVRAGHPAMAMGLGARARGRPRPRAARERRLRAGLRGRHDLHRAGDGRASEPGAAGPSVPHAGEARLPRDDPDRGASPSGARSLRDVGTTRRLLREGLPVDEVAAGLAGARPHERHALRDPRRAWSTTPCSSRATGVTSAPRTTSPSSTTRRCSTCRLAEDVRLLGLRYLVVPTGLESPVDGRIVQEADGYSLWELADRQPEATGTDQVERARNVQHALEMVTAPGFDPARITVVEDHDVFGAVSEGNVWDAGSVGTLTDRSASRSNPRTAACSRSGTPTIPGWRAEIDGHVARTSPSTGSSRA